MDGLLSKVTAALVAGFARLVTAVRGEWRGFTPSTVPRVYFANHSSNGDFVLLWSVLPPALRERARPVAAADYWLSGSIRRFLIQHVFRGVLIDRRKTDTRPDPIAIMLQAIDNGDSLILFPEGTRNTSDTPLLPFKRGIHQLALARENLEFVPVWIDNLNRVLPKGELLPIPMLCTATFGAPIVLRPCESQIAFLERARKALLRLSTPEPVGLGEAPR